MDHCHNLPHAAQGLVTHLMYRASPPSSASAAPTGNQPE